MPPKGKIRTGTAEMARSVHSWDTGVVCHSDTSYIHIRKGEFLLGEFTICIKQVQLNGFSLVFKFDNYHWNFKSRYFTGFGCLTVTCTEFVLIRLLMVIEWWDWEHLVTLRPGQGWTLLAGKIAYDFPAQGRQQDSPCVLCPGQHGGQQTQLSYEQIIGQRYLAHYLLHSVQHQGSH